MEFLNVINKVLSKPRDFFVNIKKEKGIKNPLVFFIVFAVILSFANSLYFYRVILKLKPQAMELTPILAFLAITLIYILNLSLTFLSTFLVSGITHLFVLLMKGKNGFHQTFKAVIYGDTPRYLVSILLSPIYIFVYPQFSALKQKPPEFYFWFVPLMAVGIAVGFYALYLKIIGINKLQDISAFRAFAAVFLLPAALVLLVGLIVFLIIFLL